MKKPGGLPVLAVCDPLDKKRGFLRAQPVRLGDQQIAQRRPADVFHNDERIALLGFSQGACLALEFAARNAQRFGGLVGLSGGLIGPEGTPRDYPGSLAGTPVFLGCSDVDPHIPLQRVEDTASILQGT